MKFLATGIIFLWIGLLAITWWAFSTLGVAAAELFITDMSHPWRAQFNLDFTFHLILLAVWIWWREQNKLLGTLFAALCCLGGVYTAVYILAAIVRSQGDSRRLLLGTHADG